jgi:hypothetical protein
MLGTYVGRLPLFEEFIEMSLVFNEKAVGTIINILHKLLESLAGDDAFD